MMMGGRGPIICKFGVQCHRQDCWYSHPDGRLIDAPGGGSGTGSGTAAAPSFENGHISNGVAHGMHIGSVGAGGAMVCWPGMEGGAVQLQPSPRLGAGGGGVVTECRYGFDCKRPGCHFSHPYGRAIDGDASSMNSGGGGGGRPLHSRAPSTSSMGSLVRGMSELSFGSYNPANSASNDQDLKETWFPKARDCTCCKGYIFGCTADICQSMGQCTCSIEEQDLDGFSLISPKSISRASSPQFETVANGSSPARVAREVARSPPPPTEAAIAAAAVGAAAAAAGGVTFGATRATSGGGRPSLKRGGSTECRYGTGCKRLDCSFVHPQGRDIDSDGVSFGDFGVVRAGGREESRKLKVDQDLMDTWYPDCRDCPCCKGFKHGCKTQSCALAGICSCSTASNGQTGAHINGGSNPPYSDSAPPDASASGSKNAVEEGEYAAVGNVVEEATVEGGGDPGNQLAEAVAAA